MYLKSTKIPTYFVYSQNINNSIYGNNDISILTILLLQRF